MVNARTLLGEGSFFMILKVRLRKRAGFEEVDRSGQKSFL